MNITAQDIGLLIIVAVIAVSVALILKDRGKKLKCPECGKVFTTPMMDERSFGSGWALPYTGQVTCPKCGAKRSRRSYEKISAESNLNH